MIRSSGKNLMKVAPSIMFRRLFSLGSRGAVSTEYAVLVGTVGLAAVFALVAVGPVLVAGFERSRNIIVAPFP
jgi:Flp pilus assembly pilin Flp